MWLLIKEKSNVVACYRVCVCVCCSGAKAPPFREVNSKQSKYATTKPEQIATKVGCAQAKENTRPTLFLSMSLSSSFCHPIFSGLSLSGHVCLSKDRWFQLLELPTWNIQSCSRCSS